jgi:hypothetical protein
MTIQHVCFEELLFDFRDFVAGDDPWQFVRVYNMFSTSTVIPGVKMNASGERTLDGQFLKCDWEGAVTGRIYTADGRWSVEFDAVPFFIAAAPEAIEALVERTDDDRVDVPEVASFMADLNYNVWQIVQRAEIGGEKIHCEIDRSAMTSWLDHNAADTWGRVRTSVMQPVTS